MTATLVQSDTVAVLLRFYCFLKLCLQLRMHSGEGGGTGKGRWEVGRVYDVLREDTA